MNPICANCRIDCDIISRECRLTPTQITRYRKDLIIAPKNRQQAYYWRHHRKIRLRDNKDRYQRWRARNPDKVKQMQRNNWSKHKDKYNATRRQKRYEKSYTAAT